MKIRIILFIICVNLWLVICGCIDVFDIDIGDIGIIDVVSVSERGDVTLCMDEEIYITDFNGSRFTRITENDLYNGSVSLSSEGLLYVENPEGVWTLNLYSPDEGSIVLLQEMNRIALPMYSEELSYIALSEEDGAFGNINIYEKDTSRIYTLIEDAYYDYEWLPGERKIVAIAVTSVDEDTFQGVLLIKDLDGLEEEVVFKGTFTVEWDYVDITTGNNIIFSSKGEIYLYNLETKELSKWHGPEGYDYRLPPSINSSLKGYVLAKVEGIGEKWEGQLYLVKPDGEFISLPGWPFWIDEPMIIYMYDGDLYVTNLDKNEPINLTKKFYESQED